MMDLGFADGDLLKLKGQNPASDLQETHLSQPLVTESANPFTMAKAYFDSKSKGKLY